MEKITTGLLGAVLMLSITGCEFAKPKLPECNLPLVQDDSAAEKGLTRVPKVTIHDDGDAASLIQSIDQSIRYYSKLSPIQEISFSTDKVTVNEVLEMLKDLREKISSWGMGDRLFGYLSESYAFYGAASDTLITGYFEIGVRGSKVLDERFKYPLYLTPKDLTVQRDKRGRFDEAGKFVPYYTRHEIDYKGALKGKKLELVYLDDPIDRLFLHIQGSGVVNLPTGEKIRVNYDSQNGHASKLVGRLLIEEGSISRKEMSLPKIREFIKSHPERAEELLSYDPSYVFFRVVQEGPLGSLEVPLTSLRSVAVDPRIIPQGIPLLLTTTLPEVDEGEKVVGCRQLTRIVMSQDIGGAIKGAHHLDLYVGSGKEAGAIAGNMKEKGSYFVMRRKRVSE